MTTLKSVVAISCFAVMLAACQPQASEPGDSGAAPEAADLCGASKISFFVGKDDGAANRAGIVAATMTDNIRWLTPDMAVTMDYRSDRLNVRIDEQGKYTGFDCG